MFPYTFKCLKRFPFGLRKCFDNLELLGKLFLCSHVLGELNFILRVLSYSSRRRKESKLYTGDLLGVKCQQSLLRSPAIDCTIAANNSRICLTFVSLSCVIHQKQHLHLTGHTYESVYKHMTSLVTRVMLFESSVSQLKCSRV